MSEKYILTGDVHYGRQYQITDTEENYKYKNNKADKQKICNLLNNLEKENYDLMIDNEELKHTNRELYLENQRLQNQLEDCVENQRLKNQLEDCVEKAKEEIRKEKENAAIKWINIGR